MQSLQVSDPGEIDPVVISEQSPELDSDTDEGETDDDTDVTLGVMLVSPQAICSSRKLSIPVVTDINATHRLLEGRPHKIVLPDLPTNSTNDDHGPTTHATSTIPSAPFPSNPSPMRHNAWSEVEGTSFHVRGVGYSSRSKKVPSAPSLFRLLAVDMVASSHCQSLCAHPHERVQRALTHEQRSSGSIGTLPDFVFAVNLCIPAASAAESRLQSKSASQYYHWVAYFGIDDVSVLQDTTTPHGRLTNKFFFGSSDTFRDQTFKLIPRITQGNFVVRKLVGTQPSLLGTKLRHTYRRTDRYLEVMCDIGSDAVATRIVKCVLGYAQHLTVDLGFVLEGNAETTLPERMLGAVQIHQVDIAGGDGQRHVPIV